MLVFADLFPTLMESGVRCYDRRTNPLAIERSDRHATQRGALHACRVDHLPAEVFSALHRSPEAFAQEMRVAAALHWYSREEVSQEKAATIAGLDRVDFLAVLARERVDVFTVDLADLKQEVERG